MDDIEEEEFEEDVSATYGQPQLELEHTDEAEEIGEEPEFQE